MKHLLPSFAFITLLAAMAGMALAQDAAAPAAPPAGVAAEAADQGVESFRLAELDPQSARKAFDAFLAVQQSFADAAFEEYDSLEDFVARSPQGKDFEDVLRAHGFENIGTWLPVINAVEFTLGSLGDNQEPDIRQQIEEVKADTSLGEEERQRIVQSLEAIIPSANNRRIIEEMMKDPAYAEKLKGFITEE
jgi:hypothetical protein